MATSLSMVFGTPATATFISFGRDGTITAANDRTRCDATKRKVRKRRGSHAVHERERERRIEKEEGSETEREREQTLTTQKKKSQRGTWIR